MRLRQTETDSRQTSTKSIEFADSLLVTITSLCLPDMTDYLTVDDCKPAVLFLFHFPERCCNFFELSLGTVIAVENSLLVVTLDCSVCP